MPKNPTTIFEPPPPTHQDALMPVNNKNTPTVPINTLFDYQQGTLKLHNIRTINSYLGPDNTWWYTAVTASNIMVNDIQRIHMNNI